MKSSDIACTAKFAHLAGIYPKRAQAEKEADAKKLKRAEDEEDEKSAEDEEAAEEAPKEEKKSQKAKRAKVEDEEEDAEDAPDEKKDSRKAKRAKADEGKKEDAGTRAGAGDLCKSSGGHPSGDCRATGVSDEPSERRGDCATGLHCRGRAAPQRGFGGADGDDSQPERRGGRR